MGDAAEIEAFLAERRIVLLSEDIELMRAHLVKWGKPSAAAASADVLRVAWHKARTAVTDIRAPSVSGASLGCGSTAISPWATPTTDSPDVPDGPMLAR